MMLLLTIDSTFLSFFHNNKQFQRQNRRWLVDHLNLPQFYECQTRHKQYEFTEIAKKYGVKEKIYVKDHHLHTNIDIDGINDLLLWDTNVWLELPSNKFYTKDFYKDITVDIKGNPQSIYDICDDPYCYAMTRKNQIFFKRKLPSNWKQTAKQLEPGCQAIRKRATLYKRQPSDYGQHTDRLFLPDR